MKTFATLTAEFGSPEFLSDFEADLNIPVLTSPQCQGDVSICPSHLYGRKGYRNQGDPKSVGKTGVEVIRGGAMNNAHTLRTLDADVFWQPVDAGDEGVALGVLTIPDGAQCFLEHREHGFNGIGAGTYVIGRQREQADVVRMVQD